MLAALKDIESAEHVWMHCISEKDRKNNFMAMPFMMQAYIDSGMHMEALQLMDNGDCRATDLMILAAVDACEALLQMYPDTQGTDEFQKHVQTLRQVCAPTMYVDR